MFAKWLAPVSRWSRAVRLSQLGPPQSRPGPQAARELESLCRPGLRRKPRASNVQGARRTLRCGITNASLPLRINFNDSGEYSWVLKRW